MCKPNPLKISLSISLITFLAAPLLVISHLLPYLFPESELFYGAGRNRSYLLSLAPTVLFFTYPFLIAAAKKIHLRVISIIGFTSVILYNVVQFLERAGHLDYNTVPFIFVILLISTAEILYLTYLTLYAKASESRVAAKLFSIPILLKILQVVLILLPKGDLENEFVTFHWIIAGLIITGIREFITGGISLNLLLKLNRDKTPAVESSEEKIPQAISTGVNALFKIYVTQFVLVGLISISMVFRDEWKQPENYMLLSLITPIFLFCQCMTLLQIIRAKTAAFTGTAKLIFIPLILLTVLSLMQLFIAQFLPSMEQINVLSGIFMFFQSLPSLVVFYGVVILLRKAAFFADRNDLRKRTTVLLCYPLIALFMGIAAGFSVAAEITVLIIPPLLVISIFLSVFFLKTVRKVATITSPKSPVQAA